jgi:tight adherence protein C
VIAVTLALAWAVLACVGTHGILDRVVIIRRARRLRTRPRARRRAWRWTRRVRARPIVVVARVLGTPGRRRRAHRDDIALVAELPVAIDLVGVAVGAGYTPLQALEIAGRWSPARAARELQRITRTTAIGTTFDDALAAVGRQSPPMRRLTETLRTSARLGSPAAAALGRLAHDVRADVRRRAEARARTVPVRLLFPLVFCILPAFALLTVVPVLLDGVAS